MTIDDPFDQLPDDICDTRAEEDIPPEAQLVTLRKQLLTLRKRQALGHGTRPWTNPIHVMIGWEDTTTGEIFCSNLFDVGQEIRDGEDAFGETGLTREMFKKNIGSDEGRERLYGFVPREA
jgi:hypothetical protein